MRRVAGPLKLSCAASTLASSSIIGAGIALREAVPSIAVGLELSAGPIAGDQPLLAQNLLHPAVNLLAIFAFEPDSLRWRLEKPRSDPGLVSLLRARWLSILSMPPAPGSPCIGNCILLQAHLVLEDRSSTPDV